MSSRNLPYTVFALGDTALTIDFGNTINDTINQQVINLFHHIQKNPLRGITDIVPAYSSLTVHYDLCRVRENNPAGATAFGAVKEWIEKQVQDPVQQVLSAERLIRVPVCYDPDYAPDLSHFLAERNISVEELISIHTSSTYKVYMIGFLPGFAYMGQVDKKIAMPRKPQPNIVAAGSVGIAGQQTGIYPMISPGGWHIIGRTPLKIFDPAKENPVLLSAGDTIQFYSISKAEYADH